ncbi:MAG: hypothetical protein AAF149_22930 [Bacteroidota bacterium]
MKNLELLSQNELIEITGGGAYGWGHMIGKTLGQATAGFVNAVETFIDIIS